THFSTLSLHDALPISLPVEITRNLFTTAYPRMVEILQLLGSSSFMITPGEADFRTPLAPAIEQYLATEGASARERVKLFRLAWRSEEHTSELQSRGHL